MYSDQERRVFCLVGMAGTGKTTIAQTFCHVLEETGQLGASFFRSKANKETREGVLIAPTIAYQLSLRYEQFGRRLLEVLEEPGLLNSFQNLVLRPFQAVGAITERPVTIVIDTLDEANFNAARLFHDLRQLTSKCPFTLKVFLTFRPEFPFHGFEKKLDPSWTILHNVEKEVVE